MVASLTYRTSDNLRWGGGFGSDLSALQIDLNFWVLFSALQALEDKQTAAADIDYMVTVGNQLFVHLTNHRVLGPLTIPTANWQPKGAWAPLTLYGAFNTVTNNGSLYLVLTPHTSGATFSPLATDGLGQNLYSLLVAQPNSALPEGGTIGQRLAKASGSPYKTLWQSDFIRLAPYIEGQPTPNEVVMQYCVTDHMILPAGLAGTVAYAATPTNSNVSYTLFKNGAAIGSINFVGPSPNSIGVAFGGAVSFVPGDILTLVAPTIPDVVQANISITILATLTG